MKCFCGFYASYSSSIIYHPNLLLNRDYCFAAVRMYGDCVLAQNGLRASRANVVGVLFSPMSRNAAPASRLLKHLQEVGIFHAFSAQKFIGRFPDEPYDNLLKFDPVARLANSTLTQYEAVPPTTRPDDWYEQNVDSFEKIYCRPMRPELMQRIEVERTDTLKTFNVSLKPEYRPGGELYRHPLLEAWGE